MRHTILAITAIPLITAGCGQRSQENRSHKVETSLATYDVAEPAGPSASAPQIAYTYTFAYELGSSDIAAVQARQLEACRRLGPSRCLVLKSSISGGAGGSARGDASLVVDARLAPAFNRRLDAIASDADGTISDRSVTAEDVTKDIIDTDARVRAKEALAARLLSLIQTTGGNVGELVSAEKAYAATQEELDAAKGLQAALRRRVAMSQIDIGYTDREASGTFAPLRNAVTSAGQTLGTSLGAVVTVAVAILPWGLLLLVLRWIARRLGWRGPLTRLREWRTRRTPAD